MENTTPYWTQLERSEIYQKDMQRRFYQKVNDNDDPFKTDPTGFHLDEIDCKVEWVLLPMAKGLKAKGEMLYVNLFFVDFDKGKKNSLQPRSKPEKICITSRSSLHPLEDQIQTFPNGLEVILEPDHTARWKRGSRRIGDATAAAMRQLTSLSFSPELILLSTKRADLAVRLFEEAVQMPSVRQHVGAIAYHRYAKATPAVVDAIAATSKCYGVCSEMIEFFQGSAHHLHEDLSRNAAAWQSY